MSWVLEAKKRVHVDEGQMQTGAVAEEQIAGYPQLARLVRETKGTCSNKRNTNARPRPNSGATIQIHLNTM